METRLRPAVGALAALLVLAGQALATDDASQRLLAAAARGDAAQVAALARQGGDPNARDASSRPALLLAVSSGRPEVVRALLRAGAAPDAGDRSGWTALHQAVANGDLASARVLLDAGATPDLRSRARGSALDVAERDGRAELARLLRERGARGSGKSVGDTVCVRPWAAEPPPNGRPISGGGPPPNGRPISGGEPPPNGGPMPGGEPPSNGRPISGGEGYCGVVLARDATRFQLRVTEIVGCARGCAAEEACSGGRPVGAGGISVGDRLWVPASCLTHTGVER